MPFNLATPSCSFLERDRETQTFANYKSDGEDIIKLMDIVERRVDHCIEGAEESEFFLDDECNLVYYFRHRLGQTDSYTAYFNNHCISGSFE